MSDKHPMGDSVAEIQHEKKQNRKIDVSLYLSIAALLVTAMQFIISTPFFAEYYYKASFEVIENTPIVQQGSYTTNYTITNPSKNNVNGVEIGIQILKSDVVQILPNPNIQVNYKDNGPVLKSCYFTIDKLIPNEKIMVMVHSNADSMAYYHNLLSKTAKPFANGAVEGNTAAVPSSDEVIFPSIILAKFEKGFATVKKQPRQKVAN